MKPWSDLPSQMLLEALEDLEKIENTPGYVIDMNNWHAPVCGSVCAVCLAGSVMSKRMDISIEQRSDPFDFDSRKIKYKLLAVDNARKGNLYYFHEHMLGAGINTPEWLGKIFVNHDYIVPTEVSDYKNKEDFKNWILGFVGILQSEGF